MNKKLNFSLNRKWILFYLKKLKLYILNKLTKVTKNQKLLKSPVKSNLPKIQHFLINHHFVAKSILKHLHSNSITNNLNKVSLLFRPLSNIKKIITFSKKIKYSLKKNLKTIFKLLFNKLSKK
jgi:hypothetical protein